MILLFTQGIPSGSAQGNISLDDAIDMFVLKTPLKVERGFFVFIFVNRAYSIFMQNKEIVQQRESVAFNELKELLDQKAAEYNHRSFIENDPISLPHRFTKQQDIEIVAFLAATLAWGQRSVIIKNGLRLIEWMDGQPYEFVRNHQESDLRRFLPFVHRTFHVTDLLYFIAFFKNFYNHQTSLESAFLPENGVLDHWTIEQALIKFHHEFFSLPDFPIRTVKHVATPARKSACKRINMFLRWMVRQDEHGVDFGLWKKLRPELLICPLDIHVERVARKLGLLERKQTDWQAALELTKRLREFDPYDPVKYDFALFGLGLEGFAT